MSTPTHSIAVVIGASIAGLLAANALASHCEKVIILERDTLPDSPIQRNGVAQGSQVHILLQRGLIELEKQVPGFTHLLTQLGAVRLDPLNDFYLNFPFGVFVRTPTEMSVLSAERPVIEYALRALILRRKNIQLVQQARVVKVDLSRAAVPRVTFSQADAAENNTLHPDWLIDASGRSSRVMEWLQQSEMPLPQEEHTKLSINYASCLIKNPTFPAQLKASYILARAPHDRMSGLILPVHRDGTHLAALQGFGTDMPSDFAGFRAAFQRLRDPLPGEALSTATAVDEVRRFNKPRNHFRHMGFTADWPLHFLTIGDSIASINPIYGQGMTGAALAARVLGERFGKTASGSLQRKITRQYRTLWEIASSEDLRWPETTGKAKNLPVALGHLLGNKVVKAATREKSVALAYAEVMHVLQPPTHLFKPHIALKWLFERLPRD